MSHPTIRKRVPVNFKLAEIVFDGLEDSHDHFSTTSNFQVVDMYTHDGEQFSILVVQEQQLIIDCATDHSTLSHSSAR